MKIGLSWPAGWRAVSTPIRRLLDGSPVRCAERWTPVPLVLRPTVLGEALLGELCEVVKQLIHPDEILLYLPLNRVDRTLHEPRSVGVAFGVGQGAVHLIQKGLAFCLHRPAEAFMLVEHHGGEPLLISDLQFTCYGEAH